MVFETNRLIIRKWKKEDYKDLFEYCSDCNVTKFLTFPTYTNTDAAVERINCLLEKYNDGSPIQDYCIELKGKSKVIGAIGVVKYKESNQGEVEIGYVLNPKFQGNGYMTEALKGMFKYIKENKIAKRIVCCHDVENTKSGNVMKRAGMTLEGIMRRAGENNYHSRHDLAMYSILDEEIDI